MQAAGSRLAYARLLQFLQPRPQRGAACGDVQRVVRCFGLCLADCRVEGKCEPAAVTKPA